MTRPAMFTNNLDMTFVQLPPGKFVMGSPPDEPGRFDRERQVAVELTQPFSLGVTPVTQRQWRDVMGDAPWSGMRSVQNEVVVSEGDDYPAVGITWHMAQRFCQALSEKLGQRYRLPSEAQWEYACRAGTQTAFSFGNDPKQLGDYAWYRGNSWEIDQDYAHGVAMKKPNAWGLYDMHGNVYEWCNDWYAKQYPAVEKLVDPVGPERGRTRVMRGGAWRFSAQRCRSADRYWGSPARSHFTWGLRVMMLAEQ